MGNVTFDLESLETIAPYAAGVLAIMFFKIMTSSGKTKSSSGLLFLIISIAITAGGIFFFRQMDINQIVGNSVSVSRGLAPR